MFSYKIIKKFDNSKNIIPLKVITTIFGSTGSKAFERNATTYVYYDSSVFKGHFYIVRKTGEIQYLDSSASSRFFNGRSRGAKE